MAWELGKEATSKWVFLAGSGSASLGSQLSLEAYGVYGPQNEIGVRMVVSATYSSHPPTDGHSAEETLIQIVALRGL